MASIIDPIYGHVAISNLEQLIINTPEMGRLRRIQQLGLADLAFPGANHTRFEHSVGTMFMADKIAKALGLTYEEILKVRMAALLHDVGHCAFSHVVESILKRNPSYQPVLNGKNFMNHEDVHEIHNCEFIPHSCLKLLRMLMLSFFQEVSRIATGDIEGVSKPYLTQIISNDIEPLTG